MPSLWLPPAGRRAAPGTIRAVRRRVENASLVGCRPDSRSASRQARKYASCLCATPTPVVIASRWSAATVLATGAVRYDGRQWDRAARATPGCGVSVESYRSWRYALVVRLPHDANVAGG